MFLCSTDDDERHTKYTLEVNIKTVFAGYFVDVLPNCNILYIHFSTSKIWNNGLANFPVNSQTCKLDTNVPLIRKYFSLYTCYWAQPRCDGLCSNFLFFAWAFFLLLQPAFGRIRSLDQPQVPGVFPYLKSKDNKLTKCNCFQPLSTQIIYLRPCQQ